MVDLSIILAGFADAFTPFNLLFVLFGVVLGSSSVRCRGSARSWRWRLPIPSPSASVRCPQLRFWSASTRAVWSGGAVPAVLMNTPGTPDAAATAMDGYPDGPAGQAVEGDQDGALSSTTGDLFSDIVLITVSAPLAILALRMGR